MKKKKVCKRQVNRKVSIGIVPSPDEGSQSHGPTSKLWAAEPPDYVQLGFFYPLLVEELIKVLKKGV
ncbi:MAG: hypothetical protein JW800_04720 [Candidatus Omnitrophica bacterium]|nr:hypothetical protein [Candidatus Omnitrophota bacterium]